MGREIERKYLVTGTGWMDSCQRCHCEQGYLCVGPPVAARVRIMDGRATLNVKKATLAIARLEFEYAIPLDEAREILENLCMGARIEKTRYRVSHEGMLWEVDVFHGENEGLIVAEIELESEDQAFARPSWLGVEVSDDPRYLNAALALEPYSRW